MFTSTVNRKMLSELAIDDAASFSDLVNVAKEALKSGKKPEVNCKPLHHTYISSDHLKTITTILKIKKKSKK